MDEVGCAAAGPGAASYWLQGSIHRAGQQDNINQIPSPLMGEESKVRVKTMHQHRHVIADLVRNPEGRVAARSVRIRICRIMDDL